MKKLKKKRVVTKKSKTAEHEKPAPWQRESTPRDLSRASVRGGGKAMRLQKHQGR
ncbi:MAG: hypothetical protein O2782_02745 [bacterium]|nr:hypothetical protein [bacterium]